MGVRILGRYASDDRHALYDSVTGFAFGPTFRSLEEAESFLLYCHNNEKLDLRNVGDKRLEALYSAWLKTQDVEA